jgi:hypothetical protein
MEIHWNSAATRDFSEAHTLALSIRALVAAGEFDWTTPGTDPYAHWPDSMGGRGTILALQEMLRTYDLPPLASHQFQHSPLSATAGQLSDYRYDLDRLATSRYFDFFYSGVIDLVHEPEDIVLFGQYAVADAGAPKGVYASCDFHIGPQTTWPPIAALIDRFRFVRWVYRSLFRTASTFYLKLKGEAELALFPHFAEEQLTHATYVFLGGKPCLEGNVLDALRDGRTCVTRGVAEFAHFAPTPSFSQVQPAPVRLQLDLPRSYSKPRPRGVIVFRDGRAVHWEPYSIIEPSVRFSWVDRPPPGIHVYQVYVPSKFLSGPILVSG